MSGSTSRVAGTRSSCRPPWLDTITASTPSSTARTASSVRRMPLTAIGPSHSCRIHSRSFQDTVPSNISRIRPREVAPPGQVGETGGGPVAPQVELEPQRAALGGVGDRLQRLGRQRGHPVGQASPPGGAGHRELALVVEHPGCAHRRQDDGQRDAPRTVVLVSTWLTSRITRGTSSTSPKAARLRRMVHSSSPPRPGRRPRPRAAVGARAGPGRQCRSSGRSSAPARARRTVPAESPGGRARGSLTVSWHQINVGHARNGGGGGEVALVDEHQSSCSRAPAARRRHSDASSKLSACRARLPRSPGPNRACPPSGVPARHPARTCLGLDAAAREADLFSQFLTPARRRGAGWGKDRIGSPPRPAGR